MGRVRVRTSGNGAPDTRRVEVNAATTWKEFLEGVRQVFYWDNTKEFALSLNRLEEIYAEPDSLLSDVGVCSGDLVWVMGTQEDVGAVDDAMEVGPADPQNNETASTSPANPTFEEVGAGSSGRGGENRYHEMVSRVRHEGDFLPRALRQSLATLTEPTNQYLVVIATCQAALMEIGFVPLKEGPPCEERGGIYILEYSFLEEKLVRPYNGDRQGSGSAASSMECSTPPKTILRCVKMADYLMLYVNVDGYPSCWQMTVHCTKHVSKDSEGAFLLHNWWDLWKDFKEKMAIWVTFVVASAVGCLPELALLSLPEESKEAILAKLDFKDLLSISQTCTDLNRIGSSDRMWGPLYVREYHKDPEVPEEGGSIKSVFRADFLEKRQREYRRRLMHPGSVRICDPPYPIMPGIPAFGQPGVVGGDLDRHPFWGVFPGLGGNNAFGRGRGFPGRGGQFGHPFRGRGRRGGFGGGLF
ncbi:hypothetical protein BSKO_11701 [Bryopsis sp. KO-2023]|nr:hypothetical protein BSKO_11701 [Bryopsis sp. KO-2023]